MEVSSFSTAPRVSLSSSSTESSLLKRVKFPLSHRCLVPISWTRRTAQLFSDNTGFLVQNTNSIKISCSQQREIPVVEARCMDEVYDALAESLLSTSAAASNPNMKVTIEINSSASGNSRKFRHVLLVKEVALLLHIVGLAGPPGAGKSTLASEVVRRVNKLWPQKASSIDSQVKPPDVATILPMDGFHLYRSQLDAMENPEEAHARRGAPWTFDPLLFLNCLKNLRNQGSVYAPSFDHGVGDPVEDDIFVSLQHKVVIVEGNYLFLDEGVWKDISSMFDEKWFIDIDLETSMQRVLKRHISTGKPPDVAKWRIDYNDRPNAELIMQSKKNADLVISKTKFNNGGLRPVMVHVVRKMAIVTQKHLSYKQPGKTKLPQEDKKGATYCGKSRNMGFSIGCQLSERQKDDAMESTTRSKEQVVMVTTLASVLALLHGSWS
ncbi:hypothetical protein JRO89_XS01G0276300 [Xanthoceras sorbifolium]|uniref:Phosphoribulokinase/uridine kinase domain-containing protein n=1 Tax=Xanthoceras sorbifolium TaxID=99658 RepID=A0ABQ8IMH4_9ROSI|nr:hypothetical protein JRO89_XS01G0276300 [Xanthoceras sorbifolium]